MRWFGGFGVLEMRRVLDKEPGIDEIIDRIKCTSWKWLLTKKAISPRMYDE
jgi:hypothetical protein